MSMLQWELAWEGCGLPFNTMLPFPPPDLVHSLFGLYFTHTNTQFPLLHLPTFERQWRAGLQFRDQWFACLAFTVFAVAARWSDDGRVLDASVVDEDDDAGSTHKKWYRAGRQWYQAAMGKQFSRGRPFIVNDTTLFISDITRAHRSIVYPPCLFEVQSLIVRLLPPPFTTPFADSTTYSFWECSREVLLPASLLLGCLSASASGKRKTSVHTAR